VDRTAADDSREIGPADLFDLIGRRAGWIAAAALLGALVGVVYAVLVSSSLRDPLAGAGVGLIAGALAAGWVEWGPRPARR
jgi:hypothetical protein